MAWRDVMAQVRQLEQQGIRVTKVAARAGKAVIFAVDHPALHQFNAQTSCLVCGQDGVVMQLRYELVPGIWLVWPRFFEQAFLPGTVAGGAYAYH